MIGTRRTHVCAHVLQPLPLRVGAQPMAAFFKIILDDI